MLCRMAEIRRRVFRASEICRSQKYRHICCVGWQKYVGAYIGRQKFVGSQKYKHIWHVGMERRMTISLHTRET